jgi:hypothetical protein
MRQGRLKKKVLTGVLFAVLITLGAATAVFTAGASPFGAEATTTFVTTITTGSTPVVTTITTTTPDLTSSTGSTSSSTSTSVTTITTTRTTTTTTPRKVTICHHARAKSGAVKHVTLRINRSAWSAHQRHGDSVGACNTATAKKFHSRVAHIKKWHRKKK